MGIDEQIKRKEPGFGVKDSCDVGIPAKEGGYTTLISRFLRFHVSILWLLKLTLIPSGDVNRV